MEDLAALFFLSCLTNILLTNGNRVASCATTRNSPNRTRPGEQRGSNPSADGTHKQPTKVSPYCMVMCQTADSVVPVYRMPVMADILLAWGSRGE
jgi:hypothetical protein